MVKGICVLLFQSFSACDQIFIESSSKFIHFHNIEMKCVRIAKVIPEIDMEKGNSILRRVFSCSFEYPRAGASMRM